MGTTGLAALGDGCESIVRLGFQPAAQGARRLNARCHAGVTFEQLRHFLSRAQRDPALRRQVEDAMTADEVAQLAQALGFAVSGSDILRFSGQSAAGVRVTRIDHPGEYPGRYF